MRTLIWLGPTWVAFTIAALVFNLAWFWIPALVTLGWLLVLAFNKIADGEQKRRRKQHEREESTGQATRTYHSRADFEKDLQAWAERGWEVVTQSTAPVYDAKGKPMRYLSAITVTYRRTAQAPQSVPMLQITACQYCHSMASAAASCSHCGAPLS